jgi:diadenosine tetraphosphate (Ap4A) HIT family hydrolase
VSAAHDCLLCRGQAADAELDRVQVWADEHWRLTTSVGADDPIPGFSYLEPKRHIPDVTDLDGEEARTLGGVLARVTTALPDVTDSEVVYVYVFGEGIRHLHFHLAPRRKDDALNSQLFRGEVEVEEVESGASRIIAKDFPSLPEEELRAVAERIRQTLATG